MNVLHSDLRDNIERATAVYGQTASLIIIDDFTLLQVHVLYIYCTMYIIHVHLYIIVYMYIVHLLRKRKRFLCSDSNLGLTCDDYQTERNHCAMFSNTVE